MGQNNQDSYFLSWLTDVTDVMCCRNEHIAFEGQQNLGDCDFHTMVGCFVSQALLDSHCHCLLLVLADLSCC